jgi:hypothetical protein
MHADEFTISPFVAVMRRYQIEYASVQNIAVCKEVLAPDYTLHVGGNSISGRDETYIPAAEAAFHQFPYIGVLVHEIVTNGESMAVVLTEHGASLRHGLRKACWRGIGVWVWNGKQMTEAWVELDLLARRAQLASGEPAPLDPPAIDPWITAELPPSGESERVVRAWLRTDALNSPDRRTGHGDNPLSLQPQVDIEQVDEHALFSAGPHVGFHVSVTGRYRSGVEDCDDLVGATVTHHMAGLATVDNGHVSADVVSDRQGFAHRLRSLRPKSTDDASSSAGHSVTKF